jgi:hypothetical protein
LNSVSWFPFSFWGVNTVSLTYASTTLEGAGAAIVDTGTTLIYIPQPAYNKYLEVSGGKTDSSGLAYWTKEPTGTFTITIGSVRYPLSPAQQLIPKAQ